MRGTDNNQQAMFSYISLESRVPEDHPLRSIRRMVDQVLSDLGEKFGDMYSGTGRPSIPPERLLRALLIQVLYTIRSERMLIEQLDYNMLFRWFVGLSMDDAVWDHSTFTKNRDRFLQSDLAAAFFSRVLHQAERAGLLSDEHFTVDGTLIDAWASMKSFRPRDDGRSFSSSGGGHNCSVDFHGERRRNETHVSTTDPEARLYRKGKGKEARLAFMGHALMENRNGLVVDTRLTLAAGKAEREAALEMVSDVPGGSRITVGADKGYDTRDFVNGLRGLSATPHVAQNNTRRASAVDNRTVRHEGYKLSQRARKRVEEIFGWIKTVGNLGKARHRGRERVAWMFTFTAAAYNLVRMRNLLAESIP
ncbi:IS5 family transposase [candidate division WOR-3 bacterium]|nr:IS5 family transposase [candidate division WOR-3 bacterium]